jgi:hypothetical protein
MSSKKGGKLHRYSGKVFAHSMLLSCILCIPVCFLPGHKNMFLFAIAIFTIYLVVSGQRALLFKINKLEKIKIWKDKVLSAIMLVFGAGLVLESYFRYFSVEEPAVVLAFFGLLIMFLSTQDFIFFQQKKRNPTDFIQRHIGQMSGAFIASVTAFLTAGLQLQHWLVWILPTLFILVWIRHWTQKYA